ncbi:nitroreductase [Owenweeksia hongkongensis DSM 17368]|uniref:Nitroreductase n=1 Tax=Owenweeksia hongkongensis (strain DSM 17368 / CIP 108786 / JCM 12287 / NRRL B-23963 / UST20020801) TaxID=926562 RepID=G8R8C6_OWEHD|nr:nitroreductase family protein [Owenweeksia hongkongensis]AEV33519.1 nitroreductase [Owenweeksia hongkongensis DSM 17368]
MNDDPIKTVPYKRPVLSSDQILEKSAEYYDFLNLRRSVREFEEKDVPKEVIENLIKTASTAPSGAHKQPWTFVAVNSKELKKKIRAAAEAEEMDFYNNRATEEWLKDLAPLGTNWSKPFLENAPWLIVVFKKVYDELPEGRAKNYYVQESVGIASGFLISAIHNAGLVTLTHTPSPMNFLSDILERPANEKPFLLLPVGYPSSHAQVPDLERKPLDEVSVFL